MTDTQRIEKSMIRRSVLTFATVAVAIGLTACSHAPPLRLKPVELRQLEAFLRTLSGPVAVSEPAARRTQ